MQSRGNWIVVFTAALLAAHCATAFSQIKILHTFNGGSNEQLFWGEYPGLVVDGSTIYGVTDEGGQNNNGTLYQINTNGSGFQVNYSFPSGSANQPNGEILLNGSTLIGTTGEQTGSSGSGTLYSISTNGSNYTLINQFSGNAPLSGADSNRLQRRRQ
jgi:uncharacterized repeat protein (TIGR03803 family)